MFYIKNKKKANHVVTMIGENLRNDRSIHLSLEEPFLKRRLGLLVARYMDSGLNHILNLFLTDFIS